MEPPGGDIRRAAQFRLASAEVKVLAKGTVVAGAVAGFITRHGINLNHGGPFSVVSVRFLAASVVQ